jgi:hypothetical protein
VEKRCFECVGAAALVGGAERSGQQMGSAMSSDRMDLQVHGALGLSPFSQPQTRPWISCSLGIEYCRVEGWRTLCPITRVKRERLANPNAKPSARSTCGRSGKARRGAAERGGCFIQQSGALTGLREVANCPCEPVGWLAIDEHP